MKEKKIIKNALISVYNKNGIKSIVEQLCKLNISIYSTGGTKKYIEDNGFPVCSIESVTTYPSILEGRVKTLHPKIFGGILAKRECSKSENELKKYEIPTFDIVIVDLYPFQKTVAEQGSEDEIIEKIDIGGVSLIRAAAKNYKDVVVISEKNQYQDLLKILETHGNKTTLEIRKLFAEKAFNITSEYDTHIFNYFNEKEIAFKQSIRKHKILRYGENPHQKGIFFGNLNEIIEQVNGKELSYNNLLDIDAAINLIAEFKETTFAILKHNNACGLASREILSDAWDDALAGDPVSAFGGVLITNSTVDLKTAEKINSLFYEVIIAPNYDLNALELLKVKKNRVILIQKEKSLISNQTKTVLNGILYQDKDNVTDGKDNMQIVTNTAPSQSQIIDLEFASKICKHTKSNAIVLVKNKQLLSSGVGQTSRVDALKQAIRKAKKFDFELNNAVMASDAFFPFSDCVEIAEKEGISAVVQPGGSIKDDLSINFCNKVGMSMVMTKTRHFKH